MNLATLARGHSANHLGTVLDGLFAVERSLLAGESLADDTSLTGQDQIFAGRIVRAVTAYGRGQTESI